MFTGYFPKFTLPSGKSDARHGDGLAMICNGQSMLVDGFEGGEPTKRMITWLKTNGVKTIDVAVLTHYHYDHYNGLLQVEADPDLHIDLVYCYDPRTLLHGVDNSSNGRSVKEDIANAYAWIRKMQSYGTRVKWMDRGDVLKFGDITWRIYRDQPKVFTDLDDGNAYAFVNDGSLILWSPEIELLLGGDGPNDLESAIRWFGAKVSGYDVSHHGNNCSQHNALALKSAGCVVAWQSCIERSGAGTTGWTEYGSRRVKQQGVPVWQQDQDIIITAGAGKITFTQGSKSIAKDIPYHGEIKEGWVKNIKGWWYRYKDGSWPADCVVDLPWSQGISRFAFDGRGYMVTGWQKIDGKWYFFDEKSGAMKKGWIFWSGSWFYLDPESGVMHTGWIDYKQKRCYLEPSGRALRNCVRVIDGKTYQFDDGCYATEISGDVLFTKAVGKLNEVGATRLQFVLDIANYVRKYAPQYGIKVYSPIIAQAIHESGWGESKLSAKYHNYFGLKCGTKWTGKSVNMKTQEEYSAGTLSTISANFRAYDNMEEGVKGYFEFIQLPRYSNLKGVASPRKYLENIIADGYATGKQYVDHVMNLVNLYNLTQFDVPVDPLAAKLAEDPVDVLIRIMEAEVGTHEGPNNHTKYGDEMHAIQPSNMDKNAPWCDCWFDWCILKLCEYFGYGADMARKVLCGDFDDYTYASVALYKKAGRWSSTPHRGDQIFFGGSGHTGIVTAVESGIVKTIEGNKSDQVKACSYSTSSPSIIGYGRPRYDLITGQVTAEDMPYIKRGSRSDAVKKLQELLNAKGYKLSVDGDFGPATEAAVKAYQAANHLTVDGEVGEKTWGSLMN